MNSFFSIRHTKFLSIIMGIIYPYFYISFLKKPVPNSICLRKFRIIKLFVFFPSSVDKIINVINIFIFYNFRCNNLSRIIKFLVFRRFSCRTRYY